MPAAPLNLLPFAPAAGPAASAPGATAGQGATTGQGAAAGFEALLAALFGAAGAKDGLAVPVNAAASETDAKPGDDEQADAAVDQDATAPAAQTLAAAFFFAPPQATPQPVGAVAAAEGAEGEAGPSSVTPTLPQLQATPDETVQAAPQAQPQAQPQVADVDSEAPRPPATQPILAEAAPNPGVNPAGQAAPKAAAAVGAPTNAAATEPAQQPVAPPAAAEIAEVVAEAAPPADARPVPAEPARAKAPARAAQPGAAPAAADAAEVTADAQETSARTPNAAATPPQKSVEKAAGEPALAARAPAADTPTADEASSSDTPDALPQSVTAQAGATPAGQHAATAVVRGSPETVASLAAEILKKLDGKSTRFDVELEPAGLGRVDVRIEIGAHGRLTAAMSFDNPHAAAELRSRSGELQRALEQAGFDLSGGLSFNAGGDRGGAGQGLAGQQQQDNGGAWGGRAFQAALEVAGEASDAAAANAIQLQRRSDAGVDIRI